MVKSFLQTCFISAPIETDTSALRVALEKRGIEWRDAVTATPGTSIMETIERAIGQSDFVCVVLPSTAISTNVSFEMGLARGLKRPLLVFAPDEPTMPIALQDVLYTKAAITDAQAVNFYLDAFLQNSQRRKSPKRSPAQPHKKRPIDVRWAHEQLGRLGGKSPRERAEKLEDIVSHLFESTGAVVSRSPATDIGADMAVWIDEIESTIGNPLLVEVKAGVLEGPRIEQVRTQMQNFFSKVHAAGALVIYEAPHHISLDRSTITGPLTFWISIRELVELVQRNALGAAILRERNSLFHGVG